ncbi:MAG: TIGR03435 family protein [Acidobacteria bacterium]|nr:TIGR03435 family protein [Acidobacteriota bacterium]
MIKRIQATMMHRMGGRLRPAKVCALRAACFSAVALSIVTGILNAPFMQAQSQTEPKASFEVASIKIAENCGNTVPGFPMKIPSGPSYQAGGRYTTCSQLSYIIRKAYQVDIFSQFKGFPGWSEDILYKIEAKAGGNPDKEQMRLMVQSLLEERFKLKMHRETKDTPVYLLVIAKDGHKLQRAKDEKGNPIVSLPPPEQDPEKIRARRRTSYSSMEEMMAAMPPGSISIMGGLGSNELNAKAISTERLATALYSLVGMRRVIDKTGLTGLYDLKMTYSDSRNQPGASTATGSAPVVEPSAPTIFKALQEQLGLKLEEDKAALDEFVIDNVEKPSEN